MSLHATLQCLQCKRLITEADTLEDGKCSCGALLISIDAKVDSSKSKTENATPGLFDNISLNDDDDLAFSDDDGIAFSDDEKFLTAPSPIEAEHNKTNDSFDAIVARSQRKQVKLSDDSDNKELTASSTKKMKQWSNSLEEEAIMKQYDTSSPVYSDSEYQPSNSEDDVVSEALRHTQKVAKKGKEQAYHPSLADKTKKGTKAKASTIYSLSPSSSSLLPTTASRYKIRRRLTKGNQDSTPQELTQMIAETSNKLTEEQNATKKSDTEDTRSGRKRTYPSGNGFMLFNSEQYHLVSNEYSIKTKDVRHVASIVGKRWKELDPEIKDAYYQRAKTIRDEWILKNPDEYQACQNASKTKRRNKRLTRRRKATL